MSDTTSRAGRTTVLISALLFGGLILLGAVVAAVPRITGYFTDYWNGRAGLLTARQPQVPIEGGRPEAGGLDYDGLRIVSDEALLAPRTLQALAEGLGILVIIAGGLLAVLLAVRMLRGVRSPGCCHGAWARSVRS
ncbi:hypothetical protein [Microbacterium sp. NIBRBAC000506063]|uniref:hypothetical protein n=1 Tax=Microbacterium sp. NIBRBAC000506063 TaxID=2734618 RepID=UPI001BB6AC39|nr:hypothetical protein [Microbacterium sp. NIBRBAC000506063]QTV79127.1 hypothetical protein KAE78_08455 [Microbacterium sp. NIBRBAC000506063]